MRIKKRHNSVLYIINIVNPNKEFELKKLALERIDKVEDRIIQTNIMFILGLTFLNAIYGILFKNNFLTLFSKTYSLLNLKIINSNSVSVNSNNSSILFTLLIVDVIIFYIWHIKILEYNEIKRHINSVLRNGNFLNKDLLEDQEKKLNVQILENILIVWSFSYIAAIAVLHFYPEFINAINAIIIIYYIILLLAYALFLMENLSKTKNQRKIAMLCIICFFLIVTLIVIFKNNALLTTSIIIIIFVITLIITFIWNEVIRRKNNKN